MAISQLFYLFRLNKLRNFENPEFLFAKFGVSQMTQL